MKQKTRVFTEVKLNQTELPVNEKGYAPLLFFSDLHLGHPQCNIDKAKEMLDWALRENCSIILLGDLIECSLRDSVGDGVYQQKLNPQDQIDEIVLLLKPLAKNGLIIGLHSGNHCMRVQKATSIDPARLMAQQLGVPYMGYAGWYTIKVGKQHYNIYATHGASGATMAYTKLNAAIKMSFFLNADILAYAHVHDLATTTRIIQEVDWRKGKVVEHKQYVVITGSYLDWAGGYAEMKGYSICKIGSPKAKLRGDVKDVHFSL